MTALSFAKDEEKWMAFRFSCCAISSSWDESSSCRAVVAWLPAAPSLREVGVGPNVRLNADVLAVSEGLMGKRDGRAVLIREGDTSAGSGGTMNNPFVDTDGFKEGANLTVEPESKGGLSNVSSSMLVPGELESSSNCGGGFGSGSFARSEFCLTGFCGKDN